MLELPSPRKRPEPPEQIGTSQPHSKKQQLNHPSRSQPPSVFWNSLSKSWLTKRALREQDRRNRQAAPSPSRSPHRRARRPVTRKFIAEQKTNREAAHCTGYLSRCTPRILKNISLFARHGGPDLSDLRNVCLTKHLPASIIKADAPSTPTLHIVSVTQRAPAVHLGAENLGANSAIPQPPRTRQGVAGSMTVVFNNILLITGFILMHTSIQMRVCLLSQAIRRISNGCWLSLARRFRQLVLPTEISRNSNE